MGLHVFFKIYPFEAFLNNFASFLIPKFRVEREVFGHGLVGVENYLAGLIGSSASLYMVD